MNSCLKPVEVVLEAGAQIVEHAHVGPALKMFDDVAADEAGAAGDQYAHSLASSMRVANVILPGPPP